MSGLSGLFEEELERVGESWKERVLGWRGEVEGERSSGREKQRG